MADVDMNQGHQQAELQAAIKAAFDELIRAGLPPNEAAAQALIRAQDALRNSKMAEPVAAESEDAGEIQKEKDAHMSQEAPKSDAEVPREQTEIITVEGIRQCLQQGLDQPDEAAKYRPLIHFIGRAFASPASLNSSFPPHIESMEVEGEEMKASEETLNIDIEEVAEVYKLIAEQEHEGVLNSLSHAFESLLYNQQFTTLNLRSCLDLRQFLVVFECPLIMDPSYKLVLASLFQCLIKLPKESQEHIQNWLARQARERLGRYVAATQQYITLRVYLESVEEARPAVAVLGLLWAANGGGGGGGVLPAKAFHNDAVPLPLPTPSSGYRPEPQGSYILFSGFRLEGFSKVPRPKLPPPPPAPFSQLP